MEVDFKESFLHMDVLCVGHYNNYILAGIGNHLFIYQKSLLHTQPIFPDERIHSIYVKHDLILLKGCKKLSLIKINQKHDEINTENVGDIQCTDFIQDVVSTDNELVGLVTAHNCFQLWDLKAGKCLETQQCVENCILYSCKIIGNIKDDMTIFAGTVFGHVLIWSPIINATPLKRLNAHNGAVFSIEVKPNENLIMTTSDDRSLKIWSVTSKSPLLDPQHLEEVNIDLVLTLFGHTARVWRSLVLEKYFITIGEDSQLILWSRDGKMIKAISLHQESGIRAVHSSPMGVITGGEDGGVNQFPIEWLTSSAKPASVNMIADGSTKVCITDYGIVYVVNGTCVVDGEVVYKNEDFGSYSVVEVSPMCLIMGSIKGRLVVLNLKTKMVEIDQRIVNGRLYSIHYLGDCFLTCGPEGRLDVWSMGDGLRNIQTMTLPPSKERWTTCAIIEKGRIIVGDRMGGIYAYNDDNDPVKSFRKIHSYQGVTDIHPTDDGWMSIGRDGTVKTFTKLQHSLTCKLPMDWPWKIVRYNTDILILGFHSVLFTVWSTHNREVIASHDCGGGHRSCDFLIAKNILTFLYIKDKKLQTVNLNLNSIKRVRSGYHGKEINCLKILQAQPKIIITGSEDTTVRIGTIGDDIQPIHVLTSHISSVRAVKVFPIDAHQNLIISVGGKGQLVIHKFNAKTKQCELLINHRLKTEMGNWKTPALSIDPDTRIMCVDIEQLENRYVIAAGCSDCNIRLFNYNGELCERSFVAYNHCILNVKFVGDFLVSMGTDGRIVFWDYLKGIQLKRHRLHQSGINSCQFEKLGEGKYILVTGGDDNLICVTGVEILKEEVTLIELWGNSTTHSCQVTGIKILKNYILTTSIDQRITVWKWSWKDTFKMDYINQCMSSVPDIQGMDATWCNSNTLTVIVHGKGIQVVKIDLH